MEELNPGQEASPPDKTARTDSAISVVTRVCRVRRMDRRGRTRDGGQPAEGAVGVQLGTMAGRARRGEAGQSTSSRLPKRHPKAESRRDGGKRWKRGPDGTAEARGRER